MALVNTNGALAGFDELSRHSAQSTAANDDQDNRHMGRTQQLHRQFKTHSLVGFTVTLGATWPYAIVSSPLSLANGGPAGGASLSRQFGGSSSVPDI